MTLLRQAGDFGNKRVVEYATIIITIPNGMLPSNLKEYDWEIDEETPVILSASPTGRLTRKELTLESVELAEQYAEHLRRKFKSRSYCDNYTIKVTVKTDSKTMTINKNRRTHSAQVKKELGLLIAV